MPAFDTILIGHDSLTVAAARMIREGGNLIRAVVTRHAPLRDWALQHDIPVQATADDLPEADWLLSVANLDILSPATLACARKGAVNFHDGPLPAYAGLNAPVWALLAGEARHGITWHLIEGGVDEGRILAQSLFEIDADDTAMTLNGKAFAAGIESFPAVLHQLMHGLEAQEQDLSARNYCAKNDRPARMGVIDPTATTAEITRLIRALDHGGKANPLTLPKLAVGDAVYAVTGFEEVNDTAPAGQILAAKDDSLTFATADSALRLTLSDMAGLPAVLDGIIGELPLIDVDTATYAKAIKSEGAWRKVYASLQPASLPALGGQMGTDALVQDFDGAEGAIAAFAAVMAATSDTGVADFAWLTGATDPLMAATAPLRFDPAQDFAATLDKLRNAAPLADLALRIGADLPTLAIGFGTDITATTPPQGMVLALSVADGKARLTGCPHALSPAAFSLIAARIAHQMAGGTGLSPADQALITTANATDTDYDISCIHDQITRQAQATPDAVALICEDRRVDFATLDARANAIARRLQAMGVGAGQPVGLCLRRSEWLATAALGIWKAGGAYVPLDPAYPADRVALYIEDSGASVIVTDRALAATLPDHQAQVLCIEDIALDDTTAIASPATPSDLAYLIYTSGSTGRPKGVMLEHRHVANFFAGMDARIPHQAGDTWLAVTSLSFDISVLELFWTLSRGLRVVVASDADRTMVSRGGAGKGMDFSLYYWGNDDGVGRDKYRLLLEGARFADDHGFTAIWTPERHFHAFGGPYPNPSVTGAAVAAITRNLAIRAGSCVAPLHHPARIAEEWAVIDNLTDGKTGLAIASGWQPEDFVLRPENTPPKNKTAMFEIINQLRDLWAGRPVAFPDAKGGMLEVITQPRPISKTLPVWVTTAGNPDTWREAGAIGANVLTHLLGQSIAEVAEKIKIYHAALRQAGHDPADFTVTLMLHTYIDATREAAREVSREPMKDYLRSAAGLIKQYAWAFPAFKKPATAASAQDVDLQSLEHEEMEAILDFAFERYFEDSGLFGTVEDARARVEDLQAIGVGEVACLIDYGIPTDQVLAGLRPLAQVVADVNRDAAPAEDDFSLAAQIRRHNVTHLQFTPSMARMFVMDDDSRAALSQIKQLMVGGEALAGSLVTELQAATKANITNMYGPTETTIWSTTAPADPREATGPVGTPIANTQVHVLADDMSPLPAGVAGELWIGGEGVARGYWQRPDLTEERFVPDPFRDGGRLYRTGDLARWRADGSLDFLGRADHQVKLRGYRIELGEIEAVLDAQEGVRQSVVMAREDSPGVQQLVAYILAKAGQNPAEAALKDALRAVLPVHMVPARIVTLAEFPLTPNRKIDRKALPAPKAAAPTPIAAAASVAPNAAPPVSATSVSETSGAAAPAPVATAMPAAQAPSQATQPTTADAETAMRAAITAVWGDLLGLAQIDPRENFFEIGGHSLLAVQAHRALRERLGLKSLSITDIFRFPTLGALASRLATLGGKPAPQQQAPHQPVQQQPQPTVQPVASLAPATPTALQEARVHTGQTGGQNAAPLQSGLAAPATVQHAATHQPVAENPLQPVSDAVARRRALRERRALAQEM